MAPARPSHTPALSSHTPTLDIGREAGCKSAPEAHHVSHQAHEIARVAQVRVAAILGVRLAGAVMRRLLGSGAVVEASAPHHLPHPLNARQALRNRAVALAPICAEVRIEHLVNPARSHIAQARHTAFSILGENGEA